MREIEVTRLPHVTDQYLRSLNGKHGAQERDCQILIDEDVLIKVDGKPKMVYLSLNGKVNQRWFTFPLRERFKPMLCVGPA